MFFFALCAITVPSFSWEGKVFDVKGKKVTIATTQSAGVSAGIPLYVLQNGIEVGRGRATSVFHTKVEMTLLSGRAEQGLIVTTKKPTGNVAEAPPISDGSVWTQSKIFANTQWSAVGYGNGVFVALGYDSIEAAVSKDGKTWKKGKLPERAYWKSVTYGNGVFVAVAAGRGAVAVSKDGIKWRAGQISSRVWEWVVFGNGAFLAGPGSSNDDLTLARSVDGISWTDQPGPDGDRWISAVFAKNIFVATGREDRVAVSTDGITWQRGKLPQAPSHTNGWLVTYGNDLFVAVTTRETAISSDGMNWKTAAAPFVSTKSLTFGNGIFLVIIDEDVRISKDGLDWSKRYPLPVYTSSIAAGNGIFAGVGMTANGGTSVTSP